MTNPNCKIQAGMLSNFAKSILDCWGGFVSIFLIHSFIILTVPSILSSLPLSEIGGIFGTDVAFW